jgi:sugar lactone lactonase YvrE
MPSKQLGPQELHTLLTGITFGECPRWHEDRLWFSDWGTREIIAVNMAGNHEVMLSLPSFPFSFDWLPDGRMLVTSVPNRLLLRQELDGSLVTHADLTRRSDRPWNEIVVDGRGNAYVNNIGFDFPGGEFAPGTLAMVTPDGMTRQVAEGVAFPNGMAVTADNSTLILAESYGSKLTAFDIAADGSLANCRVWAGLPGGAPDGICLDAEGAVWYGDVPNKRCVRVREGGEVVQTIELDHGCFACMLGGPNRQTLFMLVADWAQLAKGMGGGPRTGRVLYTQAPAPGIGWP